VFTRRRSGTESRLPARRCILSNEITDGGKIIAQKAVEVQPDDTPETLQRRVMEQAEWILLPQAVEDVAASLVSKEQIDSGQ